MSSDKLGALMVSLLWAVHITLLFAAPSFIPLTLGIRLGLHWVIFSWIIDHPVGIIHAVVRTALVTAAWRLLPDARPQRRTRGGPTCWDCRPRAGSAEASPPLPASLSGDGSAVRTRLMVKDSCRTPLSQTASRTCGTTRPPATGAGEGWPGTDLERPGLVPRFHRTTRTRTQTRRFAIGYTYVYTLRISGGGGNAGGETGRGRGGRSVAQWAVSRCA